GNRIDEKIMQTSIQRLSRLGLTVLLSGTTAMAGSFSNSFSDPNDTAGFTLNGSGTLADGNSWMPVVQDGHLSLTVNQGSLNGTIVFDDLDAGQPIESFTAKFKLLLSGSADGVGFCFGPDITSG